MALLALLMPGLALADGVSGLIEEQYTSTRSTVADQTGASVRDDANQLIQRYRLGLDRAVFPLLRFNAGGVFEQDLGHSTIGDADNDLKSRTTNLFGALSGGNPILGFAGGYTWREQTTGTALI